MTGIKLKSNYFHLAFHFLLRYETVAVLSLWNKQLENQDLKCLAGEGKPKPPPPTVSIIAVDTVPD